MFMTYRGPSSVLERARVCISDLHIGATGRLTVAAYVFELLS